MDRIHKRMKSVRNTVYACGIYKITNIENNKSYVGQTCSTQGFEKRRIQHFNDLKRGKHSNAHLQNAYNLYGKDKFTFEILEYVYDNDLLDAWEEVYFKIERPEYNILTHAGSPRGRKMSQESREKLSRARKGIQFSEEHCENIRLSKLGTAHATGKRSEDVCKKMSVAHKGKKLTDEHRAAQSAAYWNSGKPPNQLGKKWTPEMKEKLRLAQQARRKRERNQE